MNDQTRKWVMGILFVVGIAVLVGLLWFFLAGSTGRAVFLGETPAISEVNLVNERSVIFTVLPEDGGARQVPIRTALFPFACNADGVCQADQQESVLSCPSDCRDARINPDGLSPFRFNISRVGNLLTFTVTEAVAGQPLERIVARDLFRMGQDDSVDIFLDEIDAEADLRVELVGTTINVTDLHFSTSAGLQLNVRTAAEVAPQLIQLGRQQQLELQVSASSEIRAPTLTGTIRRLGQTTTANVLQAPTAGTAPRTTEAVTQFQAPATGAPFIIELAASVADVDEVARVQHSVAVGGFIYLAPEVTGQYPRLTMHNASLNPPAFPPGRVYYNVSLAATREKQGFGIPCTLVDDSVNQIFGPRDVQRIFGWDAINQVAVTTLRGGVNQIQRLQPQVGIQRDLFQGYFITLNTAREVNLNLTCDNVPAIIPAGGAPMLGEQQRVLQPGWNLISIPGTIPRALAEFVRTGTYQVYECRQGHRCSEQALPAGTRLVPGRPYWVFTQDGLALRYVIR
jgi:hypothetical protein